MSETSTRPSYRKASKKFPPGHQTLTFKDANGILHERTFVAERIDAAGQVISIPGSSPE